MIAAAAKARAQPACPAAFAGCLRSPSTPAKRFSPPGFKGLLKRACAIGRRRPELADATLKTYQRDLERRRDRLLAQAPDTRAGRKLRRDVPATNNVSERHLRPSVIFRKVTNGFRSVPGAEVYAGICAIAATGGLNGHTALDAIRATLAGRPETASPAMG